MYLLWLKAFHIIFVVCWFAGIFYLPRLFVYHAMATDQATRDHLKIMEHKLYRFVTPFAILTVILGIWMAAQNWAYFSASPWFHAKVALVSALLAYHFYCGHLRQELYRDKARSERFYRILNELPVLLLFAIVILVVVRPF